ncbi:recombinase family protein [Streptomyces phaeolivaceus]|uniref:Recombinase family protein n=1 Tax=Streptomyces phaeolivaceus TaxID=2653200 RepID=A0A5P8KDI2_9ACTN|nr:recombinase family protein [Streptomyces phaeolivaceus]QFR01081.1 recombinase family protein [Streptomyces phaeolivaceus]
MVSERRKRRRATPGWRTTEDVARRQNIADAATEFEPVGPGAWKSQVSRFRVIIYLCAAPNANISVPREQCGEYATAFGWDVVAVIEDRDGLGHPGEREGLKRVLERIEQREAGAVLTPSRSMISPVAEEYAEISRRIEKWGAFLQVAHTEPARARAER